MPDKTKPLTNQCMYWLIIGEVLSQSREGNFTGSVEVIYPLYSFENFRLQLHLPGAKELNTFQNANISVTYTLDIVGFKYRSRLYTGPRFGYHCVCRCPGTLRCYAISRCSAGYKIRYIFFRVSLDIMFSTCMLLPLLLTWFNFNPAWISNHTPCKVWDEITYPFLNFNGCTVEV